MNSSCFAVQISPFCVCSRGLLIVSGNVLAVAVLWQRVLSRKRHAAAFQHLTVFSRNLREVAFLELLIVG